MIVFILGGGTRSHDVPKGYQVQFRGTRAIAAPRLLHGFSKQPVFTSTKGCRDEAR